MGMGGREAWEGVNRSGGGCACTDESGSFGYRRNVLCNWRRKGGRGIGVVSEKEVVMEVV
jgi:hypothetical protein